MRWIFLTLLLCNAAYMAWQWQVRVQPVSMPKPIPASSVSDMEGKIILLSELQDGMLAKDFIKVSSQPDTGLDNAQQPDVTVAGVDVCIAVGVFEGEEMTHAFTARMAALDIVATMRVLDVSAGSEYWVYLDPLPSRQHTLRKLNELRAKNIDSYVITQGERSNGIALGYFVDQNTAKQSALRLQNSVKKAGYEAKMLEGERTRKEYWAILSKESELLFGDELWRKLKIKQPQLQKRNNLCKDVAPVG